MVPPPKGAAKGIRKACHLCGNIRKNMLACELCPHSYCSGCRNKAKSDFGDNVFMNGCPICKGLCCCANKTVLCLITNHCYRKCPAQKNYKLAMDAIALAQETCLTFDLGELETLIPLEAGPVHVADKTAEMLAIPCISYEQQQQYNVEQQQYNVERMQLMQSFSAREPTESPSMCTCRYKTRMQQTIAPDSTLRPSPTAPPRPTTNNPANHNLLLPPRDLYYHRPSPGTTQPSESGTFPSNSGTEPTTLSQLTTRLMRTPITNEYDTFWDEIRYMDTTPTPMQQPGSSSYMNTGGTHHVLHSVTSSAVGSDYSDWVAALEPDSPAVGGSEETKMEYNEGT